MKRMLIAFSALAIVFTACKKDEEVKEVTPTKENLTGTWMVTAATLGGADIFNNPTFFEPCAKDDKHLFKADLSYEIVDAGTTCSPTTADNTMTWSLTNSTTIVVDDESGTISSFDGTNLKISYSSGTVTFQKQ